LVEGFLRNSFAIHLAVTLADGRGSSAGYSGVGLMLVNTLFFQKAL
jgi:hypothetical protein